METQASPFVKSPFTNVPFWAAIKGHTTPLVIGGGSVAALVVGVALLLFKNTAFAKVLTVGGSVVLGGDALYIGYLYRKHTQKEAIKARYHLEEAPEEIVTVQDLPKLISIVAEGMSLHASGPSSNEDTAALASHEGGVTSSKREEFLRKHAATLQSLLEKIEANWKEADKKNPGKQWVASELSEACGVPPAIFSLIHKSGLLGIDLNMHTVSSDDVNMVLSIGKRMLASKQS